MNKGNEGSEFGPTLQSVKGDFHELTKPLLNGGELKSIRKKHSGILTLNTSKKKEKWDGAPGLKPS